MYFKRFFNKLPRGKLYFRPGKTVRSWLSGRLPGLMERGEDVLKLEERFRQLFKARHAIAMPFARTSLFYLLKAMNLPEGSEVIMPPLNIGDMVNMILLNGLKPVFSDLAERTGNIDPADLERRITPKTRVILATHLSGIPSQMAPIRELAQRHGLSILEDASQSIGARYRDVYTGLLGDAGFFSISTLKPISSYFGGMIVTNNDTLAKGVISLISHQKPPSPKMFLFPVLRDFILNATLKPIPFSLATYYAVAAAGTVDPLLLDRLQRGNQNIISSENPFIVRRTVMPPEFDVCFSNFQARTALACVEDFQEETAQRTRLGMMLYRLLQDRYRGHLVHLPRSASPVFWRFPFWMDEPLRFRRALLSRYIDSTTTGLVCCSREQAFSEFNVPLPNAEAFMDRCVFLPIHSGMTVEDMAYIAGAVDDYFMSR